MARFSVVVSALDERADLARSLRAINRAGQTVRSEPDVVVVADEGDGAHSRVASAAGARVVAVGSSTLGAARNAGAGIARGQILVTIDADRVMSPVTFAEIERLVATGCYIGGGAAQRPEKRSLSIDLANAVVRATSYLNGLGGGMYWCRRDDFVAIGGFDERVRTVDDLDFARRLRNYGLRTGRRFVNLRQAPVTTACRHEAARRIPHTTSR